MSTSVFLRLQDLAALNWCGFFSRYVHAKFEYCSLYVDFSMKNGIKYSFYMDFIKKEQDNMLKAQLFGMLH